MLVQSTTRKTSDTGVFKRSNARNGCCELSNKPTLGVTLLGVGFKLRNRGYTLFIFRTKDHGKGVMTMTS
jgi:hypothetical protein